jgi:hypothetical protein
VACYLRVKVGQTIAERKLESARAVDRLGRLLASGSVKVKVGATGAIAFQGWATADREGLSDVCAYRVLSQKGSMALREAIAKAEILAGRKVDPQKVAAGVHSHDGGETWNGGH